MIQTPVLPVAYSRLTWYEKRNVRDSYVDLQRGMCMYCDTSLSVRPEQTKPIDLRLFPDGFLKYPVHLQHNHDTDMTEGAVHAYCNAVLWQYEGK